MAPGTAGPGVFLSHRRDMVGVSRSVEFAAKLPRARAGAGQVGAKGMAESWGPGCAICPLCACLNSSIRKGKKKP